MKPVQNKNLKAYICTLIFASFLGTYMDLWLTGKGLYMFPARPFPSLFTINILFTLLVLPALTFFIIYIFNRINRLFKGLMTLSLSILIAPLEHASEKLGLLIHSNAWKHLYSVSGYFLFIILIWYFYKWIKN